MDKSIKIKFYGKEGCADCMRSKALLASLKVSYEYVDIEKSFNAIEEIERITNGLKKTPTIVFSDGEFVIEPSNQRLSDLLLEKGII